VTGDGQSSVDYRAYSPGAATGYTAPMGIFAAGTGTSPDARNNTHPYYYEFGLESAPAGQLASYPQQTLSTLNGAVGFLWRDVVIAKQGSLAKWYIDGKLIATVSLTNTYGGGNILFNQSDINATASTDPNMPYLHFGLIDNVRVEYITRPAITNITISSGNVRLGFIATTSDTAAAFKLQSASVVNGSYADDLSATITALANPGEFQASTAYNPVQTPRFYRIRR
jgi:hypothetical protein